MRSLPIIVYRTTEENTPNGSQSSVHFTTSDGLRHRFTCNGTISDAMLAKFTEDPSGWYGHMSISRKRKPYGGY